MPIGSGIVYNTGDLILSQVSSSGTSFLETKIAAATSSLIYFDSTARVNSASLNSITVGTASYTSGSTSIITNITASNISASGYISSSTLYVNGNSNMVGVLNMNNYNIEGINSLVISDPGSSEGITWAGGYGWAIFESPNDFSNTSGNLHIVSGSGGVNVRRITLNTDGTSVFPTGSVGIGTDSPNSKLEVAGPSGTSNITTKNTTLNRSGSFGIDGSGVYIQNSNDGDYFDFKNASGTSRFRLVYDNNTFINTTYTSIGNLSNSGSKLSVFGNLSVGSTYGSTAAPSNGAIIQGTVGIGTTSPDSLLHVYSTSYEPTIRLTSTSGSVKTYGLVNNPYWATGSFHIYDFTTDNSRIHISTGGNVGIAVGAATPANRLDVVGDLRVRAAGASMILDTAAASDGRMEFKYNGTRKALIGVDSDNLQISADSGNYLQFRTNSSERMRITDGGNIGIGTTTPSSSLTVQSNGTQLRLQTTSGPGAYFSEISARYDSTHPFGIYVANNSSTTTEYMGVYADSGGSNNRVAFPTGNVGIGTTSPAFLLDVVNTSTTSKLRIGNAGNNNGAQLILAGSNTTKNWVIANQQNLNGTLEFTQTTATGSSTVDTIPSMVINSNGNIGMGITSPNLKLEVRGQVLVNNVTASAASNQLTININGPNYAHFYDLGTNANTLVLGGTPALTTLPTSSISASIMSWALTSGNVGIGTDSPSYKLDVISGSIRAAEGEIIATGNNAAYRLYRTSGINYFDWANGQDLYLGTVTSAGGAGRSNRMVITNAGQVGIGTTSIPYTFDIYNSSTADALMSIRSSGSANARIYLDASNGDLVGSDYAYLGQDKVSLDFVINTSGNAGNIHLQPKGGTNNGILYVSGSTRFGLVSSQTHQFTGSVSISGSLNATSSWANNVVSASYAATSSRAISLIPSNSYTVDGLTANYVEVTGLATIPTTGIYRPSTKALGLSADGTLVLKISNVSAPATSSIETGNFIVGSGNVGIGTNNPSYTLQIGQSTAADNTNYRLVILRNGTLGSPGSYQAGAFQVLDYATDGPASVDTTGIVYIVAPRIATSDTNADNASLLSVVNDTGNVLRATGKQNVYVGYTTPTTSAQSNSLFVNGNLGVGTTSPRNQLTVIGAAQATSAITDSGNSGGTIFIGSSTNNVDQGGTLLFSTINDLGTYLPQWGIKTLFQNGNGNGISDLAFSTRTTGSATSLTERVRFRYDGTVGIGTTNPSYLVDVYKTSNDAVIRSRTTGAGAYVYLDSATDGWYGINMLSGSTSRWFVGSYGTTDFTITRGIGTSEYVRVTTTGNVGIGTSSPAYKLHVNGGATEVGAQSAAAFEKQSSTDGRIAIFSNSTGSGYSSYIYIGSNPGRDWKIGKNVLNSGTTGHFQIVNDLGNLKMQISAADDTITFPSASVGIGTTSPGAQLHVKPASISQNLLILERYASAAKLIYAYESAADGYLEVRNGSDSAVTKLSGYATTPSYFLSNVGIGTTSPSASLQVAGNISGSSFTSSISNAVGFLGTSSWANNVVSASFATTAQTANALNVSNTYTIAGLTSAYVDVNGAGTIPTTGIYRPSTKALGLSADGTLVFKISNASAPATSSIETGNFIVGSGNVGIGLSSPSYTLHVNGGGQKDICTVLGRSFGDGNFILTTLNGTSSNSANEVVSKIGLSYSNTGSQNAYVRFHRGSSATNGYMSFSTNSDTERMRIDASGNVGIGITNPTAKLSVTGSGTGQMLVGDAGFGSGDYSGISVNGTLNTGAYNILSSPTDTTLYINRPSGANINFRENNNDQMVLVSGGTLGIGTSSPGAKVEISGSSNSALLNVKSAISGAIFYISGSGAVGIGVQNVGTYRLQVSGSFAATTKSFVIDHPTKKGKKLIYGSLESPYHGIRLTGRSTIENGKGKVELPEYMHKLILHDSINIQVTGIKCNKTLYVDEINIPENYFVIAYDKGVFESYKDYDFFWDFTAIRADVPELDTEI